MSETGLAGGELTGPERRPRGAVTSLVVLLHGVGADGQDLIGLADAWAALLPETLFAAPDGPFPYDMAPFGRQWFSLQDRRPEAMLAGVRTAAPAVDRYLDGLMTRHGLTADRVALVGFSQGTMTALHVAPRRAQPLAGVVGYSGAFLDDGRLAAELRSRPPMLLIHGDSDPVVSPAALPAAERALRHHGVPVETLVVPGLGHGIDPQGLARGGRFLDDHLSRG